MSPYIPYASRSWAVPLESEAYRLDLARRISANVVIDEHECWVWQRFIDKHGYGNISVKGRMKTVHQISLALRRGAMWPPELQIDHLCRNRACCNPDHLELVTSGENTRRGVSPQISGLRSSSKTHCPRGHLYDETNTYIHPLRGSRRCKSCRALSERQRMASKRAAA